MTYDMSCMMRTNVCKDFMDFRKKHGRGPDCVYVSLEGASALAEMYHHQCPDSDMLDKFVRGGGDVFNKAQPPYTLLGARVAYDPAQEAVIILRAIPDRAMPS